MFGIGPMELVLILVVALLVLGPKRMPELARTLGRGMGEFRKASNDLRQSLALDDLQNELRDGLSGVGKIQPPVKQPVKTPEAEDRPPQAGDDLPRDSVHAETEEAETAAGEPTGTTETTEADAASPRHPGELPLDADPHEHHEPTQDSTEAADGEPQPIDSELGNVPVGGTPPAKPVDPKRG